MTQVECQGCRERDARIAELEAKMLLLEGKLRDFEDKFKPPAPKPPSEQPPAPPKKSTGRKPGGQPGHPPHLKRLLPAERVSEVIHHAPATCRHCQATFADDASFDDSDATRFQVVELPAVLAVVTEHRGCSRTCPHCQKVTRAAIPDEVAAHSVGPRLTGVFSYLAGVHGVSKRAVEEIAEDLFSAPIALGTVANLEQEMSQALVPAYQEAKTAIENAPVKHVDETGWKQNGKKRWLWTAAAVRIVVFLIHPKRNLEALKQLVGQAMAGILSSDRWRVYDHWSTMRRQLCWAHLKRNWEKKIERGGPGAKLGEAWLAIQKQVFELWHLFRGSGISRSELDERIVPLSLEIRECLRRGVASRDQRVARFCARLSANEAALWTFVVEEGVEPTNNHAERVLRRAVLWRRRSFGCHSADGCRFVERILTAVQSLRLQNRCALEFLCDTIAAHRSGLTPPKLVEEG